MAANDPVTPGTSEPSGAGTVTVESTDATSASLDPALLGGNELVATSLGEYVGATWKRIRAGESGALPVVVGLVIIVLIFQSRNGHFLSAINLVNLIQQTGVFVMLGMAEIFVLLLGEIDLSVGYMAAVGATIIGELQASPYNYSWWSAIIVGLVATMILGLVQGLLITRLKLPSFVVTLGGLLGFEGLQLYLIDRDHHVSGGTISITNKVINDIVNGSFTPAASWIIMVVAVVIYAALNLTRDARRRSSGLVTPPLALTTVKILGVAVAGVVVVLVCNLNRGSGNFHLSGLPWVVPIVLVILVGYTFLLGRTRFGRYLYAIGGNAEAARRAGVNLNRIRLVAFVLTGLTAGIGGVLYESQLGGISNNINGGTYVLYAVAAAVIGGTSLFGGRGKMVHAVLGGIVIGVIFNGTELLGLGAAAQDMVTALVLLAAVIVDAVAHRSTAV